MTLRIQKRLTVCLGLIAMWLLVVAPLVSHILLATRASNATDILCSATSQLESRDDHDAAPDRHHVRADHSDACGYCSMLGHHAFAPATPLAAVYLACVVVAVAGTTLLLGFTPGGVFPTGRPRAPPLAF